MILLNMPVLIVNALGLNRLKLGTVVALVFNICPPCPFGNQCAQGQFELKYDQLVVATGCEVATFGIPGVREVCPPYFSRIFPRIMFGFTALDSFVGVVFHSV